MKYRYILYYILYMVSMWHFQTSLVLAVPPNTLLYFTLSSKSSLPLFLILPPNTCLLLSLLLLGSFSLLLLSLPKLRDHQGKSRQGDFKCQKLGGRKDGIHTAFRRGWKWIWEELVRIERGEYDQHTT